MADKIARIKKEIKKVYKENAHGQVGGGKCDDCSRRLSPRKAYLIPGNKMWCEDCTDKFLNASYVDWSVALKNVNNYFGPGLPARIQDIADGQ